MRAEQSGKTGRLVKGIIEEGGDGRRWRMCFAPNKRWCIEFDEDAVVEEPRPVPDDELGRWIVRLRRDVPILETRTDTIVDILKGYLFDPSKPPLTNSDGLNDEDGGEVGDPTSRGGPC
jgi:hypothetical protein